MAGGTAVIIPIPRTEENELDFDRDTNVPKFSPEEEQRIRIQANICRKRLLKTNPNLASVMEGLSAWEIVELHHGIQDQLMMSAYFDTRNQIAERVAKRRGDTYDEIISASLKLHEETATKPLRKKSAVDVVLPEIHVTAQQYLVSLFQEDAGRVQRTVECEI